MKRMLFGMREGMTDHELAKLAGYNGVPLGCHMTLATGDLPGLSGPVGATLRRGTPLSTNICYWGSNICRAGWIASSARDLPSEAQDYVEDFAGPYFEVMAEWFDLLRIGTPGGDLARLVAEKLPFEKFGIFLNAGHLIHLDEWLSSPIYPGSDVPLHSGMVMQVDVIPSSRVVLLHAHGGRRGDRRRDPAPPASDAIPRLLRPLPEAARLHGRRAGHSFAGRDPAALQHPGHRAAVLPEPQHDSGAGDVSTNAI